MFRVPILHLTVQLFVGTIWMTSKAGYWGVVAGNTI